MAARNPNPNHLDETAHFGFVRSNPNSSAIIGSQVLPGTNPDMAYSQNVHALAQAQGSGKMLLSDYKKCILGDAKSYSINSKYNS